MTIAIIIFILLAGLMAGRIESNLREAFSGDWMDVSEWEDSL